MSIPEGGKHLIVPGSYLRTASQSDEERQRQADAEGVTRANGQKIVEAMEEVGRPYYEAFSSAGFIINKQGQARRQVPIGWHKTASWTFANEKGAYRMTLDFHPQRPFLKEDSIIPDEARVDFDNCFGHRQILEYNQYGKVTGTRNNDTPRIARLEVGFADQGVRRLRFIGQDMYPEHLAVFQQGTALETFAKRFCYTAEKRTNNRWWGEERGRWRFEAWLDDLPVFKLGQGNEGQGGFWSTRFCYGPRDDQVNRKEYKWGDLSFFKEDGVSLETSISTGEMAAVVKSTLGLIPLKTV